MRRKYFSLFALIVILSMLIALPGFADGPDVGPIPPEALEAILSAKGEPAAYIIQMSGNPVIAYEGDISGLAATKPGRGDHFNPNSARVKKYVKFLDSKHADALAIAGGEKFYSYFYSFNGFAAVLTPAEAVAMAKLPDVVMLFNDELKFPTTDNSPEFLELTAPGGLWDSDILGEDVIIGVIDTGIWPEHPSFSDQIDLVDRPGNSGKRTLAYGPPPQTGMVLVSQANYGRKMIATTSSSGHDISRMGSPTTRLKSLTITCQLVMLTGTEATPLVLLRGTQTLKRLSWEVN